MKRQQRPSLLALSALLLCALQRSTASDRDGSASSSPPPPSSPSSSSSSSSASASASASASSAASSQVSGREPRDGPKLTFNYGNRSLESRPPSPKLREAPGHVHGFSFNTSRDNTSTTVTSTGSGRTPGSSPEEQEEEEEEEEVSPLCAYRLIEGGIGGQLCFRDTLFEYTCEQGECRSAVTHGNLVANVLLNGSVLLQWSRGAGAAAGAPNATTEGRKNGGEPKTSSARAGTLRPRAALSGGRRRRRGGYELSCWWNGSYTQFECAGVHLASGCRDFLLTELHENIPYRLCLRSLGHPARGAAEQRDCVEFTLPPSGMQDIVIAMTTVGGAICVMLVIICLLVAYITENIMSPTAQHAYSYRAHSHH